VGQDLFVDYSISILKFAYSIFKFAYSKLSVQHHENFQIVVVDLFLLVI